MKRVLVIEDDNIQKKILEFRLNKEVSFDTVLVSEYADAIRMIELYNPDLILTDLILETNSGIDIIRHANSKNIKVIAMSVNEHMVKESIIEGVDDFIQKPFDVRELIMRIERLLAS